MFKKKLIGLLACFGLFCFSGTLVSKNNSVSSVNATTVTVNFGSGSGRTSLNRKTSFTDSANNKWSININGYINDKSTYTSIFTGFAYKVSFEFNMTFAKAVKILSFSMSIQAYSNATASCYLYANDSIVAQNTSIGESKTTISFSGEKTNVKSLKTYGIQSQNASSINLYSLSYTYLIPEEPTATFTNVAVGGFQWIGTGNEKTKKPVVVFGTTVTEPVTTEEYLYDQFGIAVYSDAECKKELYNGSSEDMTSLASKEYRFYTVYDDCTDFTTTYYAKAYVCNKTTGGIKYSDVMSMTANEENALKVE